MGINLSLVDHKTHKVIVGSMNSQNEPVLAQYSHLNYLLKRSFRAFTESIEICVGVSTKGIIRQGRISGSAVAHSMYEKAW